MSFLEKLKSKFHKEHSSSANENEVLIEATLAEDVVNSEDIVPVTNSTSEEIDVLKATLEKGEKFQTHNIIAEKLNHLEQYIKIFSLNFPTEYEKYLETINKLREDYDEELKKYQDCFEGNIGFAIDPEAEAKRLVTVKSLEEEIIHFVDFVVNFSIYETRFSTLSSKLNIFYNALLDTKQGTDVISKQLNNAVKSMMSLIAEVSQLPFFKRDLRKKEKILNHIIYGEYIFFKTHLRCCSAKDFDDFKYKFSQSHSLFVSTDYNNLIFKFFIEDLEHYQDFITSNLNQDPSFNYVLNICEMLQNKLSNFEAVFNNSDFFTTLIQFENTVDGISQSYGNKYKIPLPQAFEATTVLIKNIEVKTFATSVLSIIDLDSASLLCEIIRNFKTDISWREFYFLCKIFELHDQVVKVSTDTVFESIKEKFVELKSKYKEYSDSFIKSEKLKLLNYNGSKSKKYIFLINLEEDDIAIATKVLTDLSLDFFVSGNDIYLNHSYFSGFKNLNENFGQYKLLEELK